MEAGGQGMAWGCEPGRPAIAKAAVLLAAMVVGTAAGAQEASRAWTMTFDTETRFYSWRDSLGNRGTQVFVPLGFQLTGRPSPDWKFETLVRSGYLWSSQTNNGFSGEVSRPVDLNLTQRVTFLGFNGWQPFAAIAVSIPTMSGAAAANVNNSKGGLDSDIVPTPVFGQGLNIAPSFGVNIALSESVMLGLGLGYTARGAFYQINVPALFIRYKPGDVATGNISLGYRGDAFSIRAMASYSVEQTTTVANPSGTFPDFRAGDRIVLGLRSAYTFNDQWAASVNVDYTHMNKNKYPQFVPPPTVMLPETFNSNSSMIRVTTGVTYTGANYSISPSVTFLYRDRNGYDPTTAQFLPAKTTWTAGLSGAYDLGNGVRLNGSVSRVWIQQAANPLNPVFGAAITNNAWIATFGAQYRM